MIYDKLPIVFLSTIASEKIGSTNSMIASYILDHLDEMQHLGIKDMAKECHVAVSSISRFCKEIGLKDFAELKELLMSTDLVFEEQEYQLTSQERLHQYRQKVEDSLQMVEKSIDIHQINRLCQAIKTHKKIAIFGLLKAESVALNLQGDLFMLGKQVYTNVSYAEQLDYIFHADEDDLIILFSYTGAYFDYQEIRALKKDLEKPQIWMISSQRESFPSYINHVISFQSKQDQSSHPYQLQFIASIIAQEYARLYKNKS